MSSDSTEVIDCAVHPVPASTEEFAQYLPQPLRSRARKLNPPYNRDLVNPPFPEPSAWSDGPEQRIGSSVAGCLDDLSSSGISKAALVPLGHGLVPDARVSSDLACATNEWLADRWLSAEGADRLFGSISVGSRDPAGAVAEIERWAGDGRFVQVVVPTEALAPYGQEQYFPIWEAAAHVGLPVVVVSSRSWGVGGPVTPFGEPRYYSEAATQQPFAGTTHLASLVSEGVFDRLPDLRFVFADGGFAMAVTLLWRVNNDWRGSRYDVPWVSRPPLDYLAEHVRFVLHAADLIDPPDQFETLVRLCGCESLLLFGSRYPYWDHLKPAEVRSAVTEALLHDLFRENALRTYPRMAGTRSTDDGLLRR